MLQQIMSTCILAEHDSKAGRIPYNEGVAVLAFEYAFWVGLTVLAAVGLGRLRRWLLGLVCRFEERTGRQ